MAYRSAIETLSISAALLSMLVLASDSALSGDVDSSAVDAAGNTVQLVYAWKPNVTIYVETRGGRIRRHFSPEPQSRSFSFRYFLSTVARERNLYVTFSDLTTGPDSPAGDEEAFIDAIGQFAGLVPDFLVSAEGEFLRVENGAAASSRMKQYLSSAVPSLQGSPSLAHYMELVSSEALLDASAAKQWERIVGFWVGARLEIGATYEAERVMTHPLIPGIAMAMTLRYGVTRRVPCEAGSTTRKCIELVLTSEVDGGHVKEFAGRLADEAGDEAGRKTLESLQITMMKEESRLITEPDTLMPHYFELRKTVEGRSGPNEADRDGRIDYHESSFRSR